MALNAGALRKIVPLLVLLAIGTATWYYLREARKPKELVLAGTIEARSVNVGSLTGGRVVRVHVDEGQLVTAGQPIVTLETETIDRQLAEQKAAIGVVEANLATALAGTREEEIRSAAAVAANDDREHQRQEAMYRSGIAPKQAVEQAATKAETSRQQLHLLRAGTRREEIAAARAQVEQQQRRLDTLMKQRAESEVRSSVSGTVQSLGLRPGDLVAPNQPVAELLESSQLWVRVYVPETLLGLVRVGQAVKLKIDTFPDLSFAGRVVSVSSRGEYTPRNVQTRAQRAEQVFGVKVDIEPDPRLKPGMAAEVDLGVKGRAE